MIIREWGPRALFSASMIATTLALLASGLVREIPEARGGGR